MKHHGITCPCFVYVPACSAQFTDVDFEAALSNSLQQFLHISGLKHEQKLCLETGTEARCFWNSTDWFREEPYFPIGHFRITSGLFLEASLGAHPFIYAVHLRTKINDNEMMFEFQKQDDRRRNHNKQSRNSSI